jgi:hypothetical protein
MVPIKNIQVNNIMQKANAYIDMELYNYMITWWAIEDSNLSPLPRQGSALAK